MKIGFLMGSFDPIHTGHINMIRESLNYVDKVIVVPSGHNPWKKAEPAPFDIRVKMIEASIKPFFNRVEVSGVENTFEPPYYANKPLNYFRDKYKDDELYIICGSDTAGKIQYWKNANIDILPYFKIIAIDREDSLTRGITKECKSRTIKVLDGNGNEKYTYEHIYVEPSFPISSTLIRNFIKNDKRSYPLIPYEVECIIKDNKLYLA